MVKPLGIYPLTQKNSMKLSPASLSLLFALLPALVSCGPNCMKNPSSTLEEGTDCQTIAGTTNHAAEALLNRPSYDGSLERIASYLNPKDLYSFLNINKNLRLSESFYSTTKLSIPEDESIESVRRMLSILQKFEWIQIGLNVHHLAILIEECPNIRHLEVHPLGGGVWLLDHDRFMEILSTFDRLKSLVFSQSDDSWSPFAESCLNGHLLIVKLLLQNDDPGANYGGALSLASENGHAEVVELLLKDRRADPAVNDSYALRMASINRHLRVVDLLLQDGRADPAARDSNSLRMASARGYLQIVVRLLEDGRSDPLALDGESLRLYGDDDVVRALQMHINGRV